MDGSVISVKDEWSFVVGNLGENAGCEDWDAAARDARRPEDRDAAGGRCAADEFAAQ